MAGITIVGVGMVGLPTGILASAFSNEQRLRREKSAALVEAALHDGEIDHEEQRRSISIRRVKATVASGTV